MYAELLVMELDISILIVDDDTSFGPALEASFKTAGYAAKWVADAEAAIALLRLTEYQGLVVDCLLPKMNGLDFVTHIRNDAGKGLPIVLISGIYRDGRFQDNAIKKTGALHFLNKPFGVEKLTQIFDEFFDIQKNMESPLLDSLSLAVISHSQVDAILNGTEAIHGFHLPLLLSILCQCKLSGQLQLTSAENTAAVIGLNHGTIHKVSSPDFESFFGVLLVENGFTSPQEVEAGLALDLDKPIGERLVDINSLSPHAIQVVQIEQMAIRTSKLVRDTSYSIKFISTDPIKSEANIELEDLPELWSDVILSKIDDTWLKSQFISWLEYPLLKGPNYSNLKSSLNLSVFEDSPHICKHLEGLDSPETILENSPDNEEATLKAIYFLVTQKIFIFSRNKNKAKNYTGRTKRLQKILKETEGKNHFEVLGVSKMARQSEIDKAYYEYVKVAHPDKIEPNAPEALRKVLGELFARINESYQVTKNEKNRKNYLLELEHGHAEKVLEEENLFETSRDLLFRGKYTEALGILTELRKNNFSRSDFDLYLSWALLKKGTSYNKYEQFIKEIKHNISKTPTEERHNATYFYVRALIYRQTGQLNKTKSFLKKALDLNPSFLPAKMEMTDLARKVKKTKNSLKGDLDNLFGNMFKKKSS